MSDLQTRLAKLRASNLALKAVTERIDSAKQLAPKVMDELDQVIEDMPVEMVPLAVRMDALPSHAAPSAETAVLEPTPAAADLLTDLSGSAPIDSERTDAEQAAPAFGDPAPFVKDVAPFVAGVLPPKLESEEAATPEPHQDEMLHEALQPRREGKS